MSKRVEIEDFQALDTCNLLVLVLAVLQLGDSQVLQDLGATLNEMTAKQPLSIASMLRALITWARQVATDGIYRPSARFVRFKGIATDSPLRKLGELIHLVKAVAPVAKSADDLDDLIQ